MLLSLPAAHWLGVLSMVQLYGIALLTGTAQVLFNTAYSAFFVRLVSREQYLEANSKLSTTRSTSLIAGPAIAGALIQALSAPVAVCLNAVSFLFSAGQVARVKTTEASPDRLDESLLRRAKAGLSYVVRHPYLRSSLACATQKNFFNFIGMAVLVLFASRDLGLSAGVIGLAFGVGAVGGLLGAVGAGWLTTRLGVGPVIALGSVVFPAAIAIAAVATGPPWLRAGALAGAEFVGGLGVMCSDVPLNSLGPR